MNRIIDSFHAKVVVESVQGYLLRKQSSLTLFIAQLFYFRENHYLCLQLREILLIWSISREPPYFQARCITIGNFDRFITTASQNFNEGRVSGLAVSTRRHGIFTTEMLVDHEHSQVADPIGTRIMFEICLLA